MIKKSIVFIILLYCFAIRAQKEKVVLKTYTFSEIEILQQTKPKPVVAFIYTDWCKICFGMKKKTFQNLKVINLLNDRFYFIKLNAEHKKEIFFLGKKFKYKPNGSKTGIHELAKELGTINNKTSYPTTAFLSSKFESNLQIDSYINSKKMENILLKILQLKS